MWKEGIVQQSRGASSSELLRGGIRASAQEMREQKKTGRASRPSRAIFIPAFLLLFKILLLLYFFPPPF
jgi:hypothetical protein